MFLSSKSECTTWFPYTFSRNNIILFWLPFRW